MNEAERNICLLLTSAIDQALKRQRKHQHRHRSHHEKKDSQPDAAPVRAQKRQQAGKRLRAFGFARSVLIRMDNLKSGKSGWKQLRQALNSVAGQVKLAQAAIKKGADGISAGGFDGSSKAAQERHYQRNGQAKKGSMRAERQRRIWSGRFSLREPLQARHAPDD